MPQHSEQTSYQTPTPPLSSKFSPMSMTLFIVKNSQSTVSSLQPCPPSRPLWLPAMFGCISLSKRIQHSISKSVRSHTRFMLNLGWCILGVEGSLSLLGTRGRYRRISAVGNLDEGERCHHIASDRGTVHVITVYNSLRRC